MIAAPTAYALYCLIVSVVRHASRRGRRSNWRTDGLAAVSVSWCQVRETVRAAVVSEHLRCKRDFIIRTTSACSATRQITTATRAISLGAFAGVGSGRQIICKRQAHRPRDVRPVPYGPRRRMTAASRWHHRTGCRSCWVRTPTSRGGSGSNGTESSIRQKPMVGGLLAVDSCTG